MDNMFLQVPARKLIIPGLPDLYHREGLTAEGMQQIARIGNVLMVFTLTHEIVTVVSAMLTGRRGRTPAGGRTLATCAHVHVAVKETPMRVSYGFAKHPSLSFRRESRRKPGSRFATILPLECFVKRWEDNDH